MESGALPLLATGPEAGRPQLIRRAKSLARLGLGWHAIEAAVAIGAGLTAGSVALIGFGADSVVESVAGIVLLWRFGKSKPGWGFHWGLNWYAVKLERPVGGSVIELGELHLRPVMAGYGYTRIFGRTAIIVPV